MKHKKLDNAVVELNRDGMTAADIARLYGVARGTVCAFLKRRNSFIKHSRAVFTDAERKQKKRDYAKSYAQRRKRTRAYSHAYRLQYKYGITDEEFVNKLVEQNGRCAICKVADNGSRKRFCVDHDHETGKVRGLLCTKCNAGIGQLNDSIDTLNAAIEYLEKHK